MTGGPLAELGRFADALRAAGIAVGVDRILAAAEALAVMGAAGGTDPYWPLRVTLCSDPAHVPIFDRVYRGWFAGPAGHGDADDRPDRVGGPAAPGEASGREGGDDGASATAIAVRDIEHLSPDELEQVRAWIALLAPAPRRRRAMRHRRARTGRVDVTRTMRTLLRNHGELSAVRHHRRIRRPRRLLLLVDVSRSMAPYSDAYLRFSHAALAAGPRTTEVIAVGTRWARLTEALRARDPDEAMRAMAAVETDWHHGTTLGPALQDFLRGWGGRTAVRGAVVVLCSDGFEFGDPMLLRTQVGRLSRLAGDLIWVDPLRRRDDYVPLGRNLAAAQAYATVRLAGSTFDALRELAAAIGR